MRKKNSHKHSCLIFSNGAAELTDDDDPGGAGLLQPASFDGKHAVAAQRQRDAPPQLDAIVDGAAGRVGRGLRNAALHLQGETAATLACYDWLPAWEGGGLTAGDLSPRAHAC